MWLLLCLIIFIFTEVVVYQTTCRRLGWFLDCSHLGSHWVHFLDQLSLDI